MTVSPQVLLVLGVFLAAGLGWLFHQGGPLIKAAAVTVAVYVVAEVAGWASTDRSVHAIEPEHGLAFVAVIGGGLLVLRYLAWAVPLVIVASCLVLLADLGISIAGVIA